MNQVTFSVRMDSNLKKQLDEYCKDFGMNVSTAINIFARAVVREKKIPFEICSNRDDVTREDGIKAFAALRAEAKENGVQGMPLKEINAEITAARKEKKERRGKTL